ncbi:hypothetical protein EKO04_001209 [Ascochyta lentis]|uniref:Uncharacterized protein n=1 Tax=Ascochyta lentis TaxID=205686 RepID=A0A8H7JBS6_9PLEO|nr:hypothetical protein EKO04_001209 [Ascochyta lentis]
MTRRTVYAVGLVLTLACAAMTIASIAMPRWVSYSPNGEREYSYGLHSRCSTKTGLCVPFPRTSDCDKDASFCNMWRTVGFLMSFGVVVELCTLVSFVVIMSGGVQRRVQGWGVVVGVLLFSAFIQCAGMAIVSYVFDNDSRFFSGFHLDSSWSMCTASWTLLVATALGITASAFYLPPEGDYEFIPDMDIEPDDQLLSRVAAWDNGYKGIGFQYTNEPPERDPDMMSIASFQSRQSISNSVRSPSMSRR